MAHLRATGGLAGLGALRTIGGDLAITDNPALASFTGAQLLRGVAGGVSLSGNPQVPAAELQRFLGQLGR